MEITTSELGLAARVTHLTKTYGSGHGAVRALDDVSLGSRQGEFTAIRGPRGSGKSTRMHIMAGRGPPTRARADMGGPETTGDGAVRALEDVSVGTRQGEFTAIMGPSGSGKSTLMHIMAGLDDPTSGRAWIGDTEITGLGDRDLTLLRRRRVGFVFQSFNLVPTLDVRANILLPFDLDGRRPTVAESARIRNLVAALGREERLSHRPH